MKFVILAAGMGKRLEQNIPKALVKIFQNKTILDFQLEGILKKVRMQDIIIVVGFKKQEIMSKYRNFNFVENNEFNITNTSKSLLKGIENLDDDVIWLNGDIYFQEEVLNLLLENDSSCCLVDDKKCGVEEIKFNINKKTINEISKNVKNPIGEALGINKIKKDDLSYFKNELKNVKNVDYFEKAIENLIKKNKVKFYPINIEKLFCVEIDYQKDLKVVKKYLKLKI